MQTVGRIPDLPNDLFFAMNRWFYKLYQTNLLFNIDDSADSIVDESGHPFFTEKNATSSTRRKIACFPFTANWITTWAASIFARHFHFRPRDGHS